MNSDQAKLVEISGYLVIKCMCILICEVFIHYIYNHRTRTYVSQTTFIANRILVTLHHLHLASFRFGLCGCVGGRMYDLGDEADVPIGRGILLDCDTSKTRDTKPTLPSFKRGRSIGGLGF